MFDLVEAIRSCDLEIFFLFFADNLLGKAALLCGFPDWEPKSTVSAKLLTILESMRVKMPWDKMPLETRENLLEQCRENVNANPDTDGRVSV